MKYKPGDIVEVHFKVKSAEENPSGGPDLYLVAVEPNPNTQALSGLALHSAQVAGLVFEAVEEAEPEKPKPTPKKK